MTQDYSPSGVNIYGSGIDASTPEPPSPLHWRTFKLPKGDPDADTAIGWELRIDDTRGGYAQYGDFGRGFNQFDGDYRKTSISTLDQRFERNLLLPPLVSSTTITSAPAVTQIYYTHFTTSKTFVMGLASATANKVLYKETSTTDPTPTAVAYDPGATNYLTCLAPIFIGGVATIEQLVIGRHGVAAEVLSDLTPTSTGTMNALTASLWGCLISPINAAAPGTPTLLLYAANTIYTLSVASAIGTAPTVAVTGIPSGGQALRIEQLQKNWPLRAYWLIPLNDVGNTGLYGLNTVTSPNASYVLSTNLEGTDPQMFPTFLSRTYFADIWNQTVVRTDGVRITSHDGAQEKDLHFLRGRANNTNYRWGCTGLIVNGGELYAKVTRSDLTVSVGTDGGVSTTWIEQYIPEFDSWIPVSGQIAFASGSGVVTNANRNAPYGYDYVLHANAPSLVISRQSSCLHLKAGDTTFKRVFISPEGVNPWNHYNQTGASANIAQAFATTGTYDSPYFSLPTLEGRRKKADQIVFGGQIAEGNVKVTINPNEGGTAVTFAGADASRSQYTQLVPSGSTTFDLLQIRIQLNQGVTTTKTPNGLPITIRGRAYLTDADIQSLGLPGGGF